MLKMRCFKCNSEEHLKAQCPLLKTHVSMDKDKKLRKWGGNIPMFGSRVLVDARERDVLSASELEVSKVSDKFVFSSSLLQHCGCQRR